MTAPSGSVLTGTLQSTTTITDMQSDVKPQPGKKISAQELENYKNTFARLPKELPRSTQSFPATLKVLARQKDGGVSVSMTLQVPLSQNKKPLNVTVKTVHYSTGTTKTRLEPVKDPVMQKAMQGLMNSLSSNEMDLFYKRSWSPGQQVKHTTSLPFDQFTGQMGAGMAFKGDLKVNHTVTYQGLNGAGEHVFKTVSESRNNVLKAVGPGGETLMPLTLSSLSGTTETRLRKDGLPSYSKTSQRMTMTVLMSMSELPVQVKTTTSMQMEQLQSWKSK